MKEDTEKYFQWVAKNVLPTVGVTQEDVAKEEVLLEMLSLRL
nr:hypothetical protein [Methylomarinum sp. Ch1-1]MDP4523333.1 hypothetical protein [Methylomarinum sp. Ch1-1]